MRAFENSHSWRYWYNTLWHPSTKTPELKARLIISPEGSGMSSSQELIPDPTNTTRAYPFLSRKMAMKIGGERNPEKLGAKNWQAFYEQAGIGRAPARQRTMAVCARILDTAESLFLEDCPGAQMVLPIIREGAARSSSLRL